MAVGAVMRQPDRDPARLAEKRTFRPPFALSVGFGPVASPPNGAFPVAPSHDNQAQSIPISSVVVEQPLPPDLVEHPGLLPLLEAPGAPTTSYRSRSRSTRSTASPFAAPTRSHPSRPGREPAAGDSPTDAPQRHRQQRLDPLPQPIRQPPTIVARDKTHRSLPRRFQQRGRTSLPSSPGPCLAG